MFEPRDPAQQPPGATHKGGRLPGSSGGNDVHLLDRLAAIYRHRRLAVSVFSAVVLLMMLQSYATIPMYRATARLLIDEEQSVMVTGMDASDPVNYWTDSEPYYETQYRILQSPGLAGYTVGKLDLDEVPEFNGEAKQQFGPVEALRATRSVVVSRVRTIGQALMDLIRPNSGTDRPMTNEPDGAQAGDLEATVRAQTDGFVGRLAVAPVVNTRLVDVSYTSADPVFAAAAVNTHVETYVERNLSSRLEAVQKTLEWVSGELATQQSGVEESDRSLAEYRESENALSLGSNTDVITTRLATLNGQVSTARANRIQTESRYRQVQTSDPTSEAARNHPSVSGATGVAAATTRLAELEGELVGLAGRYGPLHPDMIRVNSEIASAERAVAVEVGRAIETVRSEYQSAADEERRLQAEFEAQQSRAEELSRKAVDYRLLERQSASNQRVYESLLQQQNELQVVANSRANNVQLLDRAQVPGAPFSPNRQRDWLTALMLGLILSVGCVAVVDYFDDTIKTPDEVSKHLDLPLLGLVPAITGERSPMLSSDVPHDFGEAFRSLRTSLVFTSGGSSARLIAVTSTQPQEGKTTTAANLAQVLALGGARVLLIDGDMRRPSMHKTMGLTNTIGLSHILAGQSRIREAIQRTHDPNLFALTAGPSPPNPSELLSSDRMKSLLSSLESGPFDWIIVDTPPVLAVTDSVIVGPLVSGVVFVVGADMTRSVHAARAMEMLRSGGNANVIGVVLNRVDFSRNKYYYSRYYGYHYKNYYGDTSAAA